MDPEPADSIQIEGLELAVRVGVPDEERASAQRLTLSITLWPKAGFHEMEDQIEKTIDYSNVCRAVKQFVNSRSDHLIETLVDATASHLLSTFPIQRVRLELRKFVLPETKFVAAVCDRRSTKQGL